MGIKSIFKYLEVFFKKDSILYLLNSIKASIMELLKIRNIYQIFKKRKNGISVLLPTQNEERLVKLSILSFLDFADEIIVVDNGSIDNTKEIVKELAQKYSKIRFFDRPELPDLIHNRQFALRNSKYRWICRFDSDFIAYTNGENNILKLRKFLLNLPRGLIPKVIAFNVVNVDGDYWHTRIDKFSKTGKVIRGPRKNIYEFFPFFTFIRYKRREYGAYQNFMNNIVLDTVFFMHCSIKSDLSLFLRSERSNWRELGNFKKYPTLLSYIKDAIIDKYNTTDLQKALEIFSKNVIYNKSNYIVYNPKELLPYPILIKKEMEKKDVYKLKFT